MNFRRLLPWLFIFIATMFVPVPTSSVQANRPTAVGLRSFTASAESNGIRLDWVTETELDTAGFELQRRLESGGEYVLLEQFGVIGALGGVATGASYSRLDETAVYGEAYTYKLFEVDFNSNKIDLDTAYIIYIIEPTPTPIQVGGNNPPPTAPPTLIPTSTSTPTTNANTTPPADLPINTPTPALNNLETSTPVPSQINSRIDQPSGSNISFTQGDETGQARPGVALAQSELATAYPGLETAEPPPETLPLEQPLSESPTNLDESIGYPGNNSGSILPTVAVIGNDLEAFQPGGTSQVTIPTRDVIRGRIFLWSGFIIAFLIFITGVVGSIILYRRTVEQ